MESDITWFLFLAAFSVSATAYIGYLLWEITSLKRRMEQEESSRQMSRLYDHIDRVERSLIKRLKNSKDLNYKHLSSETEHIRNQSDYISDWVGGLEERLDELELKVLDLESKDKSNDDESDGAEPVAL